MDLNSSPVPSPLTIQLFCSSIRSPSRQHYICKSTAVKFMEIKSPALIEPFGVSIRLICIFPSLSVCYNCLQLFLTKKKIYACFLPNCKTLGENDKLEKCIKTNALSHLIGENQVFFSPVLLQWNKLIYLYIFLNICEAGARSNVCHSTWTLLLPFSLPGFSPSDIYNTHLPNSLVLTGFFSYFFTL